MVIGTYCTGIYKSNYHTITTTKVPVFIKCNSEFKLENRIIYIFPESKSCYDSHLSHFLSDIGAPSDVYDIGSPYGVHDHHHVREAVDMHYDSGSDCFVFRVRYDKGSYSRTDDRRKGAQFFTRLTGYHSGAVDVTLQYDVYFPSSLHWDTHGSYSNAGGKLPGLYGGNPQCSGGRDTENCFSTRYMWREDGHGELYMYFPQSNYHQKDVSIERHGTYGAGIRTSAFQFKKGNWNTLKQRVHLNDVGHTNGFIQVDFNGHKLFTLHSVQLRKHSSVKIMGLFFSTFFGGHDSSWASQTDTYTLYRNFRITVNK